MPFGRLFGGGFSSSKCKTSLRLCVGRIKLLRNKKSLATRALISEVADLLRALRDAAEVHARGGGGQRGGEEAAHLVDALEVRAQQLARGGAAK